VESVELILDPRIHELASLSMDWKDDPIWPTRLGAMTVEESKTPSQMVKRPPIVLHNVARHERPPHHRGCFNRRHSKHVLARMIPHLDPRSNPVLLVGEGLDDVADKHQAMFLCSLPLLPPSVTRNAHESL
jgi:hypothetical protein